MSQTDELAVIEVTVDEPAPLKGRLSVSAKDSEEQFTFGHQLAGKTHWLLGPLVSGDCTVTAWGHDMGQPGRDSRKMGEIQVQVKEPSRVRLDF